MSELLTGCPNFFFLTFFLLHEIFQGFNFYPFKNQVSNTYLYMYKYSINNLFILYQHFFSSFFLDIIKNHYYLS